MGLFLSKMKLEAASRSMHQFCPVVRAVFDRPPGDAVVEGVTAFIYNKMAQEVFGKRFAAELRRRLRTQYKFQTPDELDARLARLATNFDAFRQHEEDVMVGDARPAFAVTIRGLIRALMAEAGQPHDDEEAVHEAFPRLEEAATRLRQHLDGIRRQSSFVMKR